MTHALSYADPPINKNFSTFSEYMNIYKLHITIESIMNLLENIHKKMKSQKEIFHKI